MASTRNNNTPNDYCLQQRSYKDASKYNEYVNSQVGRAYNNALPCMGIMPSHMPREAFSKNSVEIESSLFGINSTNLVNPQQPVIPHLKRSGVPLNNDSPNNHFLLKFPSLAEGVRAFDVPRCLRSDNLGVVNNILSSC